MGAGGAVGRGVSRVNSRVEGCRVEEAGGAVDRGVSRVGSRVEECPVEAGRAVGQGVPTPEEHPRVGHRDPHGVGLEVPGGGILSRLPF